MEFIFYSVFITEIEIIKNKDVEMFLFYYIFHTETWEFQRTYILFGICYRNIIYKK